MVVVRMDQGSDVMPHADRRRGDPSFERVAGEDHSPDAPGPFGTNLGAIATHQPLNVRSKWHCKVSREPGWHCPERGGVETFPHADPGPKETVTEQARRVSRTDFASISATSNDLRAESISLSGFRPPGRARYASTNRRLAAMGWAVSTGPSPRFCPSSCLHPVSASVLLSQRPGGGGPTSGPSGQP
jgi:hypothetical protein